MSEPNEEIRSPYRLAATFPSERQAGRAYQRVQDLLLAAERTDLSAYRFHVGPIWYVAIVGEPPASDLDQQLRQALTYGSQTTLPDEILIALLKRRADAIKEGPWVERHYRG